MTSTAETAVSSADLPSRHVLRDALLAERQAYEAMRALVPDLALPKQRRRPLTPRQQAAVDRYADIRERLDGLRNARRSSGLTLMDDQSL
jgi:chromatin segregation and condensation protein Rec8/ScpA/Scc1 (kleisin family)